MSVAGVLFCGAVFGIWRLISNLSKNKAECSELEKVKTDVEKEFEALRSEARTQANESLRQYRELQTAIEGVKKEITVLDKHSLTSADLSDIKVDVKELIKNNAEAVKLIDGMPDRIRSLEATRNKQSESK